MHRATADISFSLSTQTQTQPFTVCFKRDVRRFLSLCCVCLFLFETRHVNVMWCAVHMNSERMYVYVRCIARLISLSLYAARCWLWFSVCCCYTLLLFFSFNIILQRPHTTNSIEYRVAALCCTFLFIKPLAIALGWFSWINNVRRNGCLYTRTHPEWPHSHLKVLSNTFQLWVEILLYCTVKKNRQKINLKSNFNFAGERNSVFRFFVCSAVPIFLSEYIFLCAEKTIYSLLLLMPEYWCSITSKDEIDLFLVNFVCLLRAVKVVIKSVYRRTTSSGKTFFLWTSAYIHIKWT